MKRKMVYEEAENKGDLPNKILAYFFRQNRSVYIEQHSIQSPFSGSDSWVILSEIEQRIKAKIEAVGTPLKDWDVQINYGIKTGLNDAFIITGKEKEDLIAEDPRSAEIIRPILRGRDIRRYNYEFADLWIIATFPSLKIDIESYPAVKRYLLDFGFDRLKQTGELGARKKTNNKWFETQDSIGYWEDFDKQKIVWGEISDRTKFCIDLDGKFMPEATTFLMTGKPLLYLIGYLNSKFSEYLFSKIGTTTGVGTVRWKKFTIEQLLVPKISAEAEGEYSQVVNSMVKSQDEDIDYLARTLNQMIYSNLSLTQEEVEFIESQ